MADVQAIHPGYGFLSENAHFAEVCRDCNIEFIGPPQEAMQLLGNKNEARKLRQKAGVPVVPGSEGLILDEGEAVRLAHEIGLPRADQGGGRRRRPRHARGPATTSACRPDSRPPARKPRRRSRTAASTWRSTSSSRATSRCRSSPTVTATSSTSGSANAPCSGGIKSWSRNRRRRTCRTAVRDEIAQAAVQLVEGGRLPERRHLRVPGGQARINFYFIEVNARIQVEHPVTELVTGIDLVREQIRIAAGEPLRFKQKDIVQRGVAIECRINAEDPADDFRPSPGQITRWQAPGGPGVRLDTHVVTGYRVPPNYDSLMAKLLVHQPTRPEALAPHAAGPGGVRRRGRQDDDPDPPRDLPAIRRSSRVRSIRRSSSATGRAREPSDAGASSLP